MGYKKEELAELIGSAVVNLIDDLGMELVWKRDDAQLPKRK